MYTYQNAWDNEKKRSYRVSGSTKKVGVIVVVLTKSNCQTLPPLPTDLNVPAKVSHIDRMKKS